MNARLQTLTATAFYTHASDGTRLALSAIDAPDAVDINDRPVFLMVHGFAQNRRAYTTGALPGELVRRGARVVLAEMRGHGLSDEPPAGAPADMAAMLRLDLPALVRAACERFGVERLHLVGHSMGGILGYALLARSERLASLTTFGAPVLLAHGRPAARLAARLARPVLQRLTAPMLPIDRVLRLARPHATRRRRGGAMLLREVVRLSNPEAADPDRTAEILDNAHPIARAVLVDLVELAAGGPAEVDGVDLVAAVGASPLPIAAVVGRLDVFGGRRSVAPIYRGPGPRLVIELPDAAHVDVTMGHHCASVVTRLWRFLSHSA